jgi:transposase
MNNLDEIEQLQETLKIRGQDVQIDYIMAVPAARHGDFAEDLQALQQKQAPDQAWCSETKWSGKRMVVSHDPQASRRRTEKRNKSIKELEDLAEKWSGKLDAQDVGAKKGKGRPMSDSGAKARFYHAVKDASLAHIIKVDLKGDLFSYEIDEDRKKYLEMLDGKLLLVTNTELKASEVVSRYKSLADIERGFRVLKSDIEIGPVYHRLPRRIRAHALVCFMALILYRVMRMRLHAANRGESPTTLLAQFKRIQQQTVQTEDGQSLNGITEINPAQKSLFNALELKAPSPNNLLTPSL